MLIDNLDVEVIKREGYADQKYNREKFHDRFVLSSIVLKKISTAILVFFLIFLFALLVLRNFFIFCSEVQDTRPQKVI